MFEALRICTKLKGELLLIHAGENNPRLEKQLESLLTKVGINRDEVKIIWKEGNPVDVLCEVCKDEQVDLLILGAMQHENMFRYYMGSVARKISRNPPCSLLLVTNPELGESNLNTIVVNGLDHPTTFSSMEMAFHFADAFETKQLMVVEEVAKAKIKTKVEDDISLQKVLEEKERLSSIEDQRINSLLKQLPEIQQLRVHSTCVFGKLGYSIGHYAAVKKADLLVMNGPDKKLGFLDRFFPHDLEYILSDLPCDLLIHKPTVNA